MAARKKAEENTGQLHSLDRFGVKHEISESGVVPDPQPALPAPQAD